jgi:phosphate transport system permease protein
MPEPMTGTEPQQAAALPPGRRSLSDLAARWTFLFSAAMTILIVVLIFLFIGLEAAPFVSRGGEVGSLFGTTWNPTSAVQEAYGLLPLIAGSAMVTLIATVLAVPFGVVGAVYMAEVARPLEREILKPLIEMLAGIPSVVLGFFGLLVVAPMVQKALDLPTGLSALSAALVLALMAVPTILTISEDAIRNVPQAYKQASMALGATRLQTIWRVTVPAALSGITAAVMLGIGRVVGETMVVLMVTGKSPRITWDPTQPVLTMTATIAAEMGETPRLSAHWSALFIVGIVLLVTTFALNLAAMSVFKRYGSRQA